MNDHDPIQIYVLCSGQDDNIGDVVLRRKLLSTLRKYGVLHIHLGMASAQFRSSLDLGPTDITYSDVKTWRAAAYTSVRRNRVWFVDKPGELQMTWRAVAAQYRLLPLFLMAKARGGRVLRLGVGQRRDDRKKIIAYRAIYRLTDILTWRDSASAATFRIGRTMADWGFGDLGPLGMQDSGSVDSPRGRLVISYRADRPQIGPKLLDALRQTATAHNLRLTVVSQVRRDVEASADLAAKLSAELIPWPQDVDCRRQEIVLRTIYRETALVVSDRLHVLIVSMTEGAIPLCLVDRAESKVQRHFDAVGLTGITVDATNSSVEAIAGTLDAQLKRAPEISRALDAARGAIDGVDEELNAARGERVSV